MGVQGLAHLLGWHHGPGPISKEPVNRTTCTRVHIPRMTKWQESCALLSTEPNSATVILYILFYSYSDLSGEPRRTSKTDTILACFLKPPLEGKNKTETWVELRKNLKEYAVSECREQTQAGPSESWINLVIRTNEPSASSTAFPAASLKLPTGQDVYFHPRKHGSHISTRAGRISCVVGICDWMETQTWSVDDFKIRACCVRTWSSTDS